MRLSDFCLICNSRHHSFQKHLRETHNIDLETYVDQYLRDSSSGYCEKCNKPTRFSYSNRDFVRYCSMECKKESVHKKLHDTQTKIWSNKTEEELADFKLKTSIGTKNGFKNMSNEAKEAYSKSRSIAAKKQFENMTEEQKIKRNTKISNTVKNTIQNWTKEQQELHSKNTSNGLLNMSKEKKDLMLLHKKQTYENKSNEEKSLSMQKRHKPSKIEQYFIYNCDSNHIKYVREYYSTLYPYSCDFYLPDLDMYIELHCSSFHNYHFYDKTDSVDVSYKFQLEEKAKTSNWYKTKLEVWTKFDIEKRNFAISNNLNYIILWNQIQIDKFLSMLFNNYNFNGFYDFNNEV